TAPKAIPLVQKVPPPVVEEAKPVEKPATLPGVATPAPTPYSAPPGDFRGHESEAIDIVLKQKIYDGKRTIGENARMIIEEMHEKELLHAAETGERLYLPDKITWSALHEDGTRYRV